MHRDTQIGLAMAIVLIGFAAAFCFPREEPQDLAPLQLPNASALDARINELPVRTYTPEHSPPPSTAESSAISQSSTTRTALPAEPIGAGIEPPSSKSSPSTAATSASNLPVARKGTAGPTGPSPSSEVAAGQEGQAFLDEDVVGETAALDGELVHIVREGETLSGIARQYLGSVARYPEIFEANRDRLRSPDDLRVNQELRIPRVVAAQPSPASTR